MPSCRLLRMERVEKQVTRQKKKGKAMMGQQGTKETGKVGKSYKTTAERLLKGQRIFEQGHRAFGIQSRFRHPRASADGPSISDNHTVTLSGSPTSRILRYPLVIADDGRLYWLHAGTCELAGPFREAELGS